MKNNCRIIITISVLLLLYACSGKERPQQKTHVIPVKTVAAEWQEVSLPIYASGILQRSRESNLAFKIGGIIADIPVVPGEWVKKGQLLAKLTRTEIDARVKQAQVAAEKAIRDLKRVQSLFADSVATREQLENVQTACTVAKANLKIANFNQKHASIFAPADGKILMTAGVAGEMVSPGRIVIQFATAGASFVMKMGLSDRNILKINTGDSAAVHFDALPNQVFPAGVIESGSGLDRRSATFQAKIQLAPTDADIISGLVGSVTIFPAKRDRVMLLPAESLRDANGARGNVFVLDHQHFAHRRPVEIVALLDDLIAVKSGLKPGEMVVSSGAAYLLDGNKVMVKESK